MATPVLLTEGGLGVKGKSHMDHLYDNYDLTFSDLKKIFVAAADGRLEGTEKTDGQNLYLSYSVQRGMAVSARNKGDLKKGGMSASELAKKFSNRGSVEAAFNDAFSAFEQAVRGLPQETQIDIFGQDADIYYNSEIQDPRNANVINYDTKTLNIHRVGHSKFSKETGSAEDHSAEENFEALQNALETIQQNIVDKDFRIQVNAVRKLEGLTNRVPLKNALQGVESLTREVGISDSQTIGEYLIARLVPMVREQIDLPQEVEKLVLKRLLGAKGPEFHLNALKRKLDPHQFQKVKEILDNGKHLKFQAIEPLENIVHDFAVAMLENLQSIFVLDQKKEIGRLRDEVGQAIAAIENSGNEDAMTILKQQMKKLKTLKGINTPAEGFVFDYDGHTYKFTGNFAPVNQILGMFKYGRKGIPPMKLTESVGDDKLVILIPGGFKPPTVGHYNLIKHYEQDPDVVKVYVLSGLGAEDPKQKGVFSGRDGVTKAHSEKIFKLYGGFSGKVEFKDSPSEDKTPLTTCYKIITGERYPEIVKQFGKAIFSIGASDKDRDEARISQFVKYFQQRPEVAKVEVTGHDAAPAYEIDGKPASASRMRAALAAASNPNPPPGQDPEAMWKEFDKFLPHPSLRNDVVNVLQGGVLEENFLTMHSLFSLVDILLEEKENNPWAICTASVGREDKAKYERCVKSVKKKENIAEELGDSGLFTSNEEENPNIEKQAALGARAAVAAAPLSADTTEEAMSEIEELILNLLQQDQEDKNEKLSDDGALDEISMASGAVEGGGSPWPEKMRRS